MWADGSHAQPECGHQTSSCVRCKTTNAGERCLTGSRQGRSAEARPRRVGRPRRIHSPARNSPSPGRPRPRSSMRRRLKTLDKASPSASFFPKSAAISSMWQRRRTSFYTAATSHGCYGLMNMGGARALSFIPRPEEIESNDWREFHGQIIGRSELVVARWGGRSPTGHLDPYDSGARKQSACEQASSSGS
jgi:hypothetical protein